MSMEALKSPLAIAGATIAFSACGEDIAQSVETSPGNGGTPPPGVLEGESTKHYDNSGGTPGPDPEPNPQPHVVDPGLSAKECAKQALDPAFIARPILSRLSSTRAFVRNIDVPDLPAECYDPNDGGINDFSIYIQARPDAKKPYRRVSRIAVPRDRGGIEKNMRAKIILNRAKLKRLKGANDSATVDARFALVYGFESNGEDFKVKGRRESRISKTHYGPGFRLRVPK